VAEGTASCEIKVADLAAAQAEDNTMQIKRQHA